MIKFFRKIRQKLLSGNQLSKYIIYAIGEIVLVVIGILIALSINNWNQNRMLRSTELDILKELNNNLESDLIDIDWCISFNEGRLNSNKIVLNTLVNAINYNDTLSSHFAQLEAGCYFTENASAYDNLKALGFQTIINDSLRNQITELYSTKFKYVDVLESRFSNDFFSSKLQPLILNSLVTESYWTSAKPINQLELATNHQFKETLGVNIFWIEYMIDQYQQLHRSMTSLKNQIKNEIKTR